MSSNPQTVFFIGECGAGKSSLLRLMAEIEHPGIFKTGDSTRVTPNVQWIEHEGQVYYDTPGIGGAIETDLTDAMAEFRVRQEIKFLNAQNGVGLIVLVHNRESSVENSVRVYNKFVGEMFNRKIPVILVVTHMDPDVTKDREAEFRTIETEFNNKRILFQAYISACSKPIPADGESVETIKEARQKTRKQLLKTIDRRSLQNGTKCPLHEPGCRIL